MSIRMRFQSACANYSAGREPELPLRRDWQALATGTLYIGCACYLLDMHAVTAEEGAHHLSSVRALSGQIEQCVPPCQHGQSGVPDDPRCISPPQAGPS